MGIPYKPFSKPNSGKSKMCGRIRRGVVATALIAGLALSPIAYKIGWAAGTLTSFKSKNHLVQKYTNYLNSIKGGLVRIELSATNPNVKELSVRGQVAVNRIIVDAKDPSVGYFLRFDSKDLDAIKPFRSQPGFMGEFIGLKENTRRELLESTNLTEKEIDSNRFWKRYMSYVALKEYLKKHQKK